jgi:hypothetical protein
MLSIYIISMVCGSAHGNMTNTVGGLNQQLADARGGVLLQASAGYGQQGGMRRRKRRTMRRHKKSSRAKKSRKSTRRRR